MKKTFVLAAFAAVAMAFSSSANAASYASELKLVSADSATSQFKFSFVINYTTLFTRLIVKTEAGVEVAKIEMGAYEKGVKEYTWNGKDAAGNSVPAGTYTWAIEAEDAGVSAPTLISDDTAPTTMYYGPRGMTVDSNITSPFYGRVYALEQDPGPTSGRTTTKGVYVMNAALEDCTNQGTTAYAGGITWPSSAAPYRPFIGEDGLVYLTDWSDSHGGVWTMDPANPAGAFSDLFDPALEASRDDNGMRWKGGAQVGGSVPGIYVQGSGANRVVYTFDEDYTPTGFQAGSVLQYNIGTKATITGVPDAVLLETQSGLWANGVISVVPDLNNTGFWVTQNRSAAGNTADVPGVVHVGLNKAVDFNGGSIAFPAGGTNGGMLAYSADKKLAAISSNGAIKIFDYDKTKTDQTAFTFKYETGLVANNTSGYSFGMAFDGAGNVYGISNQSERLRVFALPKDDNKVVTPALATQNFSISAAASVDSWTKL